MATRRVYYMVERNDAETWGILEIGQESLSQNLGNIVTTPMLYRGPFDSREEAIEREHAIWRDLELVLLVRADGVGYLPSSRYPGTSNSSTETFQRELSQDRLKALFDQASDKFIFPLQVQRSKSRNAYMVSLHNTEGSLDGYTGETLEQALEKAIAQHSETR